MNESLSLFDVHHPQPLLVVISGPSGVGKDAILAGLKQRNLAFHFVVTATSRDPRPNEVDGVDYHFIGMERFKSMIAQDELIEYAMVYNQYKGVPKSEIRDALDSKQDVIMRLDVQGAAKVRQLCPEAILIFLIPENEKEWIARFTRRKTEDAESLKLRVETARKEMQQINEFDYVVVNADGKLDAAVDAVISIMTAEHLRTNPRKITL